MTAVPDPTIGRVVHYTLRDSDVKLINQQRTAGDGGARMRAGLGIVGNDVAEGQTYPAQVVRVFDGAEGGECNLVVSLDGTDTFWACSRVPGEYGTPGTWAWPPRSPF